MNGREYSAWGDVFSMKHSAKLKRRGFIHSSNVAMYVERQFIDMHYQCVGSEVEEFYLKRLKAV